MDRKSFSVCLANLTCRCGIMLPILLVIINNDVSMKVFFTSRLLAISYNSHLPQVQKIHNDDLCMSCMCLFSA